MMLQQSRLGTLGGTPQGSGGYARERVGSGSGRSVPKCPNTPPTPCWRSAGTGGKRCWRMPRADPGSSGRARMAGEGDPGGGGSPGLPVGATVVERLIYLCTISVSYAVVRCSRTVGTGAVAISVGEDMPSKRRRPRVLRTLVEGEGGALKSGTYVTSGAGFSGLLDLFAAPVSVEVAAQGETTRLGFKAVGRSLRGAMSGVRGRIPG